METASLRLSKASLVHSDMAGVLYRGMCSHIHVWFLEYLIKVYGLALRGFRLLAISFTNLIYLASGYPVAVDFPTRLERTFVMIL